MHTITRDILNEKVVTFYGIWNQQLIRVRKEQPQEHHAAPTLAKYKGTMTKQPLTDIDNQLNQLRNE